MSDNFESQYPKMERPVFQSAVPPHLLGKLSPQEKYVVETLSKSEQQNEWIINAQLENNRIYRDLDRRLQKTEANLDARVKRVERWKATVTSRWALVVAVFLWGSTIFGKALVDKYVLAPTPVKTSIVSKP